MRVLDAASAPAVKGQGTPDRQVGNESVKVPKLLQNTSKHQIHKVHSNLRQQSGCKLAGQLTQHTQKPTQPHGEDYLEDILALAKNEKTLGAVCWSWRKLAFEKPTAPTMALPKRPPSL